MLIILTIFIMALGMLRISAVSFLMNYAEFAHQLCISHAPFNVIYKNDFLALVCAQNFTSLADSQIYISSGLIHLFVVSGSHLILLQSFFTFMFAFFETEKKYQHVLFLVLLAYGFVCGLQAPVCRALIAFGLNQYLVSKNIVWPRAYQNMIAGLLTLCANPLWISSLSLQLSWLATFCTTLNAQYKLRSDLFLSQLTFYVVLFPVLTFLQTPRPLVLIINLILTPILEFILFPLALLTYVFPFLATLFDFLLFYFKKLLTLMELDPILQISNPPAHWLIFNWLFLFFIHFLIIWHEQRKLKHSIEK